MYPESTQSLLNVHRAFWLCLKSVFAFCMVEGIMPPANLHGESTPDFIVRMYIECTFEFIEALTEYLFRFVGKFHAQKSNALL